MSSSKYRVRRATRDDISGLMAMWKTMQFPAEELAPRITEFQVAERPDGKLLGALGLQLAEKQGMIHSEGFEDFALSDQLRPLFWERLQSVANNHGLLRLWTREKAPFWKQSGLVPPDAEALERLPKAWRGPTSDWLTLKLRDDLEEVLSADRDFALFMEAEKQRTARAFQQARALKVLATLIAVILFGLVIGGAFMIIKRNPNLLHR